MLAIMDDVRWLGFEWEELRHASDYFQQLYDYAVHLIQTGKAYVEGLSSEEIRAYRGTLTDPGRESPYRDRPVEENLDLFRRMKAGEFEDGQYVLRAKIDMASSNINMRDPVVYRIRNASHHRTGDSWHIYPMYDWAHGISDAIEGVTHSLCTLEFEDHRPLYDWFLDNIPAPCHPRQIEFARGNLDYTVMSKRKLRQLVEGRTRVGLGRPAFTYVGGVTQAWVLHPSPFVLSGRKWVFRNHKASSPWACWRTQCEMIWNARAPRTMAVLDPLKVVLTNFPAGETDWLDAAVHPQNEENGYKKSTAYS